MAVRLEGLDALQKGLIDRTKLDAVKQIVKYDGQALQSTMQRNAVFKKGYSQGTTQKSIDIVIKDGGLTADVGPRTDYSPYLEYGTRFMEAQPFVRPTYYPIRAQFLSHLVRLFK